MHSFASKHSFRAIASSNSIEILAAFNSLETSSLSSTCSRKRDSAFSSSIKARSVPLVLCVDFDKTANARAASTGEASFKVPSDNAFKVATLANPSSPRVDHVVDCIENAGVRKQLMAFFVSLAVSKVA